MGGYGTVVELGEEVVDEGWGGTGDFEWRGEVLSEGFEGLVEEWEVVGCVGVVEGWEEFGVGAYGADCEAEDYGDGGDEVVNLGEVAVVSLGASTGLLGVGWK